jgi:ABC-2 type transport system ATP-binding protein
MTRHVIETKGLTKHYGDVKALDGLDLAIPEHAIVGFLGPNGAGKSTTIKLLLGLIQPTAGHGSIFGLNISKDSREIRRRVGYLAQQPHFYQTMTTREVLDFTARFFYTGPEQAIQRRVDAMLELVGLEDKANHPIKGFSGGERQRLGIAQAQINHPDLLILDEPAAALDPMGRETVLEIMRRLRDRTTIFYSTHILDDVQRVSDHVVILNKGQLVTQGPIEALLNGDGHAVYTLTLTGETSAAQAALRDQPWVTRLTAERVDGTTRWYVHVNDETNANNQLLRLTLAHDNINVLSYGHEKPELEKVFMNLVKGA